VEVACEDHVEGGVAGENVVARLGGRLELGGPLLKGSVLRPEQGLGFDGVTRMDLQESWEPRMPGLEF